jgi:hypothetical protein
MSIDEILRTVAYIIMILFVPYIGVRVWNAVVMPDELRRPVAVLLWLQAGIYTLFMTGLLLLRLWQASPFLLWVNTMLITAQAVIVLIVAMKMSKLHKARLIQSVMLAFATLIIGGSK